MSSQEFLDLLEYLEETPALVERLTDGFISDELRWKPSAGEFSALEQMCHLRDIEREGYAVRIRKLLAEREPFLPDLDGSRLARERDYNNQDFTPALDEFTRARRDNVQTLRAVSPEELKRSGIFENTGTVSLERLLAMMREHDEAHRRELRALRKQLFKRRG